MSSCWVKMKFHPYKIIFLTSLFWLLILLIFWSQYSKCLENQCEKLVESAEKLIYVLKTSHLKKCPKCSYQNEELSENISPTHETKNSNFLTTEKKVLRAQNARGSVNKFPKNAIFESCKNKQYTKLQKTSLIIVVQEEPILGLINTIYSAVKNSTNPKLIQEILVVDDNSKIGVETLQKELRKLPYTIYIVASRNVTLGLFKSRMRAAKVTKSEVITFIDAHCTFAHGWLAPLLSEVAANPNTAVSPVINRNGDDFDDFWGGFSWSMRFEWVDVPKREYLRRTGDRTIPLRTPTISGHVFSINRDYFLHIGGFDDGMGQYWSGDSVEFSLRMWMCGGALKIIPCSRVVHYNPKMDDIYYYPINRNLRRIVELWMDDFRPYYYEIYPMAKGVRFGELTSRIQLRNNLKCKNFKWFLKNVFPEAPYPEEFFSLGNIRNVERNYCLDNQHSYNSYDINLYHCKKKSPYQKFFYTKNGFLRSNHICIQGTKLRENVVGAECDFSNEYQRWIYNESTQNFIHKATKYCLSDHENIYYEIILKPCDNVSLGQKWDLTLNGNMVTKEYYFKTVTEWIVSITPKPYKPSKNNLANSLKKEPKPQENVLNFDNIRNQQRIGNQNLQKAIKNNPNEALNMQGVVNIDDIPDHQVIGNPKLQDKQEIDSSTNMSDEQLDKAIGDLIKDHLNVHAHLNITK